MFDTLSRCNIIDGRRGLVEFFARLDGLWCRVWDFGGHLGVFRTGFGCKSGAPNTRCVFDEFGDKDKIQEVEKILLQSYPGLAQANRELDKNSNSPKDKVWALGFTVFEKSTRKGGLNR